MDYNTPGGLVETLAELERRLDDLERASRLNLSVIQQGGITIEDAAGIPRLLLGQQADGSYGLQAFDSAGNTRVTVGQTGVSRFGGSVSDPSAAGSLGGLPTKDMYYPVVRLLTPSGVASSVTSLFTAAESGTALVAVPVSPQALSVHVIATANVVPSPANAGGAMGISMGLNAYQRGLHSSVVSSWATGTVNVNWPTSEQWRQQITLITTLTFPHAYELGDGTGGVDIYPTYILTGVAGTVQVQEEAIVAFSP